MQRAWPALWACVGLACSGGASAPSTAALSPQRLVPLVDGHVYQYVTSSLEGPGMFVVRVARLDDTRGELRFQHETKQLEYRSDGVVVGSPRGAGYLVKLPLVVGSTWRGEHGGMVRLTDVERAVGVPAGRFEGCVVTREERRGDRPLVVRTTICPDVGIVRLEAESGRSEERAELRSFGPPVDLGHDGVRRIE